TFGVLEFINFAHGEIAMMGAYFFYTFYISFKLPIAISLILAVLAVALLGFILEKTTFKPVRNKQEFIPLVLSIGISIILQCIVIIFYGGGSKTYEDGTDATVYHLFNNALTISLTQIIIIISSIILTTGLFLFLKHTKSGKAIRAVADNKETAAILGINVNKSISQIFILGSSLAAIAGILIAFDENMHPHMGLPLNIKAFAAIILGGVGKLKGAIVGAIIIAFAENMITGLTSLEASYKEIIVFTILIGVLIFKPYGIFGGKKEEVELR
ncbi:branched-chain amino acid ABC transporter permease, partial [Candidatus Peregrinibacteria bacterium]|nr:branched-chain amino acid ABC transporter permease [Candidatus Peregrinibacteria bacterium]